MIPEEDLKKLYELIPSIECRGLCEDNCTMILLSESELNYMKLEEDEYTRKHGVVILNMHVTPDGPRCIKLANKRCTVYDKRPLICRLFGVIEKLQCDHGCKPSRMMQEHEARAIEAIIQGSGFHSQAYEVVREHLGKRIDKIIGGA